MKTVWIWLLIGAFSAQANAMGDRPQVDPACFSGPLRVEIAGEKFAFPRGMVRSVQGPKVERIEGQNSWGGRYVCQKPDAPAWNIEKITLDLFYPKDCPKPSFCAPYWIQTSVYAKDNIQNHLILDRIPQNPDTLEKDCPVRKDGGGGTCNYVFFKGSIALHIKYRNHLYPNNKIGQTKRLVIDEIYQYQNSSIQPYPLP